MSPRPDHLSHRTLLPGALLAILVTAGALFALAVVIAVGPDGPARLWLDGGPSTINLEARTGAQAGAAGGLLAASPAGLLTVAPTPGVKGAVTLATTPRTTAQLRGSARVQRRSARLPATRRPAPSGTSPTRLVSTPTPAARGPVATPAPGGSVVKTRDRGDSSPSPSPAPVPKQRASKPSSSGNSTPAQSAPASTPAPAVAKAPAAPPTQQDTSVGLDDGVLTRVPAPPSSGG
jgi:hypothetical protein